MTEELKIKISAEVAKLKQGVSEAKRAVEKFTEGSEKGASEMDSAFKKAGENIKTSLTTAFKVGATALAGLGTSLVALGASTEEYRVAQAKLQAAFETAGASAEQASQTYNELFRFLGDSDVAVEAANHLAKLTTNQEELAEWTNICQGVYATFGDSLPIEGLTEAANETAKVGQVTGPLADALNWAGISEDEFNEKLSKCANEQEREALIRQTLNGLYSDAAGAYEETAAEIIAQNEAQAKLKATTAQLGKTVAPVITAFIEFANKALAVIVPYIQELAEKYGPTLKEVLGTVGEIVRTVFTIISENWEIFLAIAGVIAGIAAAIGLYNTVAAVKAAMAAMEVTTVWALVAAYVAQAAAMVAALAPYLLIVAAIAAVIAIIVVCVKHWDEIKEAAGKAVDFIKGAWEKVATWFDETIVQPIKNAFSGMWDNLKNGAKNAWTGIKNAFGSVATWFKDKFSQAWNNVKNIFSTGGKIFTGLKDGIANVFKTVVNGIIGGINKAIAVPFNAINKMLNSIRNAEFLGIAPFKGMWKQNPLSVPEIPKLARGGIVDSATIAMIGEQGKEAIVPLENNTEWIDKLASKINAPANGKPVKVVLNVDGKAFAETSISTINDLTRQTGSLKLNLM